MQDLTEGSIPRHIIRMSLPTMTGLFLQGMYDLVDMFWIGQLSYASVAAVTIFVSIFWVFEVVNEIIGMSSVSLISQSYGAGDISRAARVAEQTVSWKFITAIAAAAVLCLLLRPLVGLFTTDLFVRSEALNYGYLRAAALPIFFSSFSVNTIFRCTGDAKTPMKLLVASAVINIVLDPLLMFDVIPGTGIPGAGLGVFGAALATVIANTAAFLAGLFLLLKGTKTIRISFSGMCRLDREIDRKLLTIGLPSGLEILFRNVAHSVFIRMVGFYGTAAVAMIGVGIRIISLIFMPILGIVMGSGTIAGQNLGAQRIDRSISTAWYSSLIGALITTFLVGAVLIFPKTILSLFLSDMTEVNGGVTMLRIALPSLVIAAVSLGWACVFSGSGHTLPFLISCIVAKWGVMIPYSIVVIYVLRAPISYLWISFILGELAEMVVLGISFSRGKWKHKRV